MDMENTTEKLNNEPIDIEMYIDEIAKVAIAQKRISRDSIKMDIEVIMNYIRYINSLDDDVVMTHDFHLLDDIMCLNEFAPFVAPSSVRLDPEDRRTRDVLSRSKLSIQPTYSEYVEACMRFRGSFKRDSFTEVTSFGGLRKKLALFDVISLAQFKGRIFPADKPFIPVNLEVDLDQICGCSYFMQDNVCNVKDYIHLMRFSL